MSGESGVVTAILLAQVGIIVVFLYGDLIQFALMLMLNAIVLALTSIASYFAKWSILIERAILRIEKEE